MEVAKAYFTMVSARIKSFYEIINVIIIIEIIETSFLYKEMITQ